jgi:hypothetical protein
MNSLNPFMQAFPVVDLLLNNSFSTHLLFDNTFNLEQKKVILSHMEDFWGVEAVSRDRDYICCGTIFPAATHHIAQTTETSEHKGVAIKRRPNLGQESRAVLTARLPEHRHHRYATEEEKADPVRDVGVISALALNSMISVMICTPQIIKFYIFLQET